jgi:hypothetical protein
MSPSYDDRMRDPRRVEMGRLPRRRPMGLDPNYSGNAYRGQRQRETPEGAPYGRYRAEHEEELATAGGWRGSHTGAGQLRRGHVGRPSGPAGGPRWARRGLREFPGGFGRGMGSVEPPRGRIPFYPSNPDREPEGRSRPRGSFGDDRVGPRGRAERYGRDSGPRYDVSRPLRYDAGFNRSGGYGSGGYSG